jgi:16S rRNA C1402 N4-methylase RsmH
MARAVIFFRAHKSAASGDELRLRVQSDDSGLNHAHKWRETVQAVELHAVSAGLGEKSRAKFFAGRQEAETEQNFLQRSEELVVVIIKAATSPRSSTSITNANRLKEYLQKIQRMKCMRILFDEIDLL